VWPNVERFANGSALAGWSLGATPRPSGRRATASSLHTSLDTPSRGPPSPNHRRLRLRPGRPCSEAPCPVCRGSPPALVPARRKRSRVVVTRSPPRTAARAAATADGWDYCRMVRSPRPTDRWLQAPDVPPTSAAGRRSRAPDVERSAIRRGVRGRRRSALHPVRQVAYGRNIPPTPAGATLAA